MRRRRNPRGFAASALLASALLAWPGAARADAPPATTQAVEVEADGDEGKGVLHHVLLYLPNRVFDVFDLVRARVRVGPGVAAQARVTEVAALFLGGYSSVWAGLPGPRGEPSLPLLFGLESKAGVQVSVADATAEPGPGPDYGVTEVGFGAQALLLGLDLGIDPLEVLDLATGFLFIDLTGDDL